MHAPAYRMLQKRKENTDPTGKMRDVLERAWDQLSKDLEGSLGSLFGATLLNLDTNDI